MKEDIEITPGNIGEVVQDLRIKSGYSKSKLSVLAGLAHNNVNRLEAGQSRLLFDSIHTLFDILGYKVFIRPSGEPVDNAEAAGDQITAKVKHNKEAAKQRELIEQAKAKSKQWAAERKKASTNK